MVRIALGEDVFENYIQNSNLYIDKSLLIRDIIDNANKVILITRPRRFGKTLNMTMLKAYFEKTSEANDNSKYFKNLKIWECGEKYLSHFGRYPVIFITFKDIESNNWNNCYEGLKSKISSIFAQHNRIIDILSDSEKEFYNNILFRRASEVDFAQSILHLTCWLERYYNEKAILLIDEYDAPINDGYTYVEFKQTEEKDKLDASAMEGLKQIKEKNYISEAQKRGAIDIFIYGIGFCGREIKIHMEKVSTTSPICTK